MSLRNLVDEIEVVLPNYTADLKPIK